MNSFEFRTVPSVIVEFGAARRLGSIIRDRFSEKRICLVTDSFLHRGGLLAPALASLHALGCEVQVIDDVVADPPEEVVLRVAQSAKEYQAELIIGLGGGSSMDVAKLIAILVASEQPLHEMYGMEKVSGRRLPLIQIPTTAGTGSEVTPISIVTTGETTKAGVVSTQLYADLTILDAELTLSLPPKLTAATGIDAMVHAIEAFTTKHKKNPISDMLAKEALRLLAGNLMTTFKEPENRSARECMLLGSMLAGQAFANAPVAAVHALAYPIGGIFHVPHGLSNAIVLPHVLRFNSSVAAPLYAELADIIAPGCTGSDEARAQAFIDGLDQIAQQTQIERCLKQVGISKSDIPRLTSNALLQTRLLVNNPREMSEESIHDIYNAAFEVT